MGTLSGLEQNVGGLARALLVEPELLVLDEPGNHLDYQGLAWLEEFLTGFRGAILVVSHNRYLLDRVVGRIFELERGTLTVHTGNYSQYRMTKLRKLTAGQADHAANQKRLAQLEALVHRFAPACAPYPAETREGPGCRNAGARSVAHCPTDQRLQPVHRGAAVVQRSLSRDLMQPTRRSDQTKQVWQDDFTSRHRE